MRGTNRARQAGAWLVLVGLMLVSTLLRTAASRGVSTPWIAPDEMVYGLLGRSLYHAGRLAILGERSGFLSAVVPAVVGLPLSLGNLELGYSLLKAFEALVMSLAAVPVYLWGRTFVSTRWALVAAALTLVLPGLAYSGLIMSEVVFYPVLVLAAWSMARMMESPTRARRWAFCGALLLAVLTRPEAVVIVPALLAAIGLNAVIGRSRLRSRVFASVFAGIGLFAGAWVLVTVILGGPLLGGYKGAERDYPAGHALAYVAYHAGDLVLLTGVVPVCATVVLLIGALRQGEQQPQLRAYLATTAALALAVVAEVGVFASGNVGHLAERNLIGLAPLLFLGFTCWLSRGGPGSRLTRLATAVLCAAAVIAIPLNGFVTSASIVDGFSLIPLYHLREQTSLNMTRFALDAGVLVTVALFVLLPRRLLLALPILVAAALLSGSVAASRQVLSASKDQRTVIVGPVRRWIDNVATGPVDYLYDQAIPFNAVWQTVFWNEKIRNVYDLPPSSVSGPLPQQTLTIAPDGTLKSLTGTLPSASFAVAPQRYLLIGTPVGYSPRNADQSGFALWKVSFPLRISAVRFGFEPNGDLDPARGETSGGLTVYGCKGEFRLTFLVKEPETIRIELDGKEVRKQAFPSPTVWSVFIPVRDSAASAKKPCRLAIRPSALTGTTQLTFNHS